MVESVKHHLQQITFCLVERITDPWDEWYICRSMDVLDLVVDVLVNMPVAWILWGKLQLIFCCTLTILTPQEWLL